MPGTAMGSSTAGGAGGKRKRSRRAARKAARKAGLPISDLQSGSRAGSRIVLPSSDDEMMNFEARTDEDLREEGISDYERYQELMAMNPALLSPADRVKRSMELLVIGEPGIPEAGEIEGDPYDTVSRFAGRGRKNEQGVLFLPFLQSGHLILLTILLLASLIEYPGFPLTQVPDVYREQILKGIGLTYLVNLGCAFYSRGIAEKKQEPPGFWFGKVLLFGGLSLGELTLAVPTPESARPRLGRKERARQRAREAREASGY